MPQSWMSDAPHVRKSLPGRNARLSDDFYLIKQCRRGNDRAWDLLIDKYRRLIHSVPVKLGMNPDECADIFYGVCVDLLKAIERWPRKQCLRDWLIDSAARKCWQRKQQLGASDGQGAISRELRRELETEQKFREAVAALPDSSQEMLRLLSCEAKRPAAEVSDEVRRTFPGFDGSRSLEDICNRFDELG
jgi:DNA-directed RNA polymerase specialized sigma24 family protein